MPFTGGTSMPVIHKTTLERIEAAIAECREVIANKKAEIRELETTAAVIRRLEGVSTGRPFAGKKIHECALILLEEKSPQHFRELATEAVARGYTSQKGGDLEMISSSFYSVLSIRAGQFEKTGHGNFKLKKRGTEVKKPGASATNSK
jgi:hypothetical protein